MGKENNHYSDKGGHQARGEAEKVRKRFGKIFPNSPFIKPEMMDARRSMRRVPQSGKRNPRAR